MRKQLVGEDGGESERWNRGKFTEGMVMINGIRSYLFLLICFFVFN